MISPYFLSKQNLHLWDTSHILVKPAQAAGYQRPTRRYDRRQLQMLRQFLAEFFILQDLAHLCWSDGGFLRAPQIIQVIRRF